MSVKSYSESNMFSVDLKLIRPEESLPFPIFVFLPLNNRFLQFCSDNSAISQKKYQRLFLKADKVWIPEEFREQFIEFQKGVSVESVKANDRDQEYDLTNSTNDSIKVKNLLSKNSLSIEEKKESLEKIGKESLQALALINSDDEKQRSIAINRFHLITKEVLLVAALENEIYEEVMTLFDLSSTLEHNVVVSSLATMFALSIGEIDKKSLADLAFAGLLHDVGEESIDIELLSKPTLNLTAVEHEEYAKHVNESINSIRNSSEAVSDLVYRIIREHHENYDGTGFPSGIKGDKIHDFSIILHLADWFDDLFNGRVDGTIYSPAECFKMIKDGIKNPIKKQRFNPDLIKKIFSSIKEKSDLR